MAQQVISSSRELQNIDTITIHRSSDFYYAGDNSNNNYGSLGHKMVLLTFMEAVM